ncbi:MAG: DUF5702 domain-containing protein [Huintestinicola sp.]
MLSFFRNHRGSVSVFILLILIPCLLLSCVFVDFIRVRFYHTQAVAAAEAYANSLLSLYDQQLFKNYGLFGFSPSGNASSKPGYVNSSSSSSSEYEDLYKGFKSDLAEYAKNIAANAFHVDAADISISGAFDVDIGPDGKPAAPTFNDPTHASYDDNKLSAYGLNLFGDIDDPEFNVKCGTAAGASSTAGTLADDEIFNQQVSDYVSLIGPVDLAINNLTNAGKMQSTPKDSAESGKKAEKLAGQFADFGTMVSDYAKLLKEIDKTYSEVTNEVAKSYDKLKPYYSDVCRPLTDNSDEKKNMGYVDKYSYKLVEGYIDELQALYAELQTATNNKTKWDNAAAAAQAAIDQCNQNISGYKQDYSDDAYRYDVTDGNGDVNFNSYNYDRHPTTMQEWDDFYQNYKGDSYYDDVNDVEKANIEMAYSYWGGFISSEESTRSSKETELSDAQAKSAEEQGKIDAARGKLIKLAEEKLKPYQIALEGHCNGPKKLMTYRIEEKTGCFSGFKTALPELSQAVDFSEFLNVTLGMFGINSNITENDIKNVVDDVTTFTYTSIPSTRLDYNTDIKNLGNAVVILFAPSTPIKLDIGGKYYSKTISQLLKELYDKGEEIEKKKNEIKQNYLSLKADAQAGKASADAFTEQYKFVEDKSGTTVESIMFNVDYSMLASDMATSVNYSYVAGMPKVNLTSLKLFVISLLRNIASVVLGITCFNELMTKVDEIASYCKDSASIDPLKTSEVNAIADPNITKLLHELYGGMNTVYLEGHPDYDSRRLDQQNAAPGNGTDVTESQKDFGMCYLPIDKFTSEKALYGTDLYGVPWITNGDKLGIWSVLSAYSDEVADAKSKVEDRIKALQDMYKRFKSSVEKLSCKPLVNRTLDGVYLDGHNLDHGDQLTSVLDFDFDNFVGEDGIFDSIGNLFGNADQTFDALFQKMFMLAYDYGMFTDYSDGRYQIKDTDEFVAAIPLSYQGVKLASGETEKDATERGNYVLMKDYKKENTMYKTSATNYLINSELEYIFAGNASAEDNLKVVVGKLTAFRLITNFISTFNMEVYDKAANACNNIPYIGILLNIALRFVFAGIETMADLLLMLDVHTSCYLMKWEQKQSSLIDLAKYYSQIVANISKDAFKPGEEPKDSDVTDMQQAMGFDSDGNSTGGGIGSEIESDTASLTVKGGQDTDTKKISDMQANTGEKISESMGDNMSDNTSGTGNKLKEIKMTYKQYLFFMLLIFTDIKDLTQRTRNLVEVNCNYAKASDDIHNNTTDKAPAFTRYLKMEETYICIDAECSFDPKFLLIGKVFNVTDADMETESVTHINDNKYKVSVTRSY